MKPRYPARTLGALAPPLRLSLPLACALWLAGGSLASSAVAATTTAVTTPTYPTPASAKVKAAGAAGPAGAATNTTSAPSGTTPTTTYSPAASGTSTPSGTSPTTTYAPPATSTTPGLGQPTATSARPLAGAAATSTGKKGDRPLSAGAIAIAALAALLVLACVVWAVVRRSAYEPHWLISLRHSLSEAGFRLSATWSEFADWLRLGH